MGEARIDRKAACHPDIDDVSARMTETTGYPPWVVLHLPHDSDHIPPALRDQFVVDDAELARELVRMTDHRTWDLFDAAKAPGGAARAPVSRLVVDVERFPDDASEPMSRRGMGAIYVQTSSQTPLRRALTGAERTHLMETYYWPHHRRLTALVDRALAEHDRALVLDCHSFPSQRLPYELSEERARPDICIGTDAFHTSRAVRDAFVSAFESAGFSVAIDTPFAGALVPMKHYRTDERVQAVMVEVNRGLYLDEATGRPTERFDGMRRVVADCCRRASEAACKRA